MEWQHKSPLNSSLCASICGDAMSFSFLLGMPTVDTSSARIRKVQREWSSWTTILEQEREAVWLLSIYLLGFKGFSCFWSWSLLFEMHLKVKQYKLHFSKKTIFNSRKYKSFKFGLSETYLTFQTAHFLLKNFLWPGWNKNRTMHGCMHTAHVGGYS